MKNSIQHFIEKEIPKLEKIKINFMKNPAIFDKCVEEVRKDNEKLWGTVKEYIERQYDTKQIEKIYFQSDGGSWMKKGIDILGAEFVLDKFHIQKYIRKMSRLGGGETEKEREETEKKLLEWVEESWGYIKKNSKANGKYIEALRAHISSSISGN